MMRLDTRPLVHGIPERRPNRGNWYADDCLMAGIIQFPLVHDDNDPVGILHRVRRFPGVPGEIEKKDIAFPEVGIGHLVFTAHRVELECDEIVRNRVSVTCVRARCAF